MVALAASACGARFDRAEGRKANAGSGLSNTGGLKLGSTETTLAGDDGSLPTGITDQTLPSGITPTTLKATTGGGGGGTGAGVDPGPAPGVSATEIKLAYLLPLTGAAPVPSNFDKGANVYWDYANDKGGINGRKVKVYIHDTQSSASVGKQEAQKAIEDEKVFAVVVLDRLENQKAIGAYLDGRKVPNIEIQTPANLDAGQKWTFGVTIDHAVQGALVADYFVKSLGAKKAAVVYENTSELVPGKDALIKRMAALGGQVSYQKAIDGQGNDFASLCLDLSRSGATATWLYMAPTPAAKIANQCAGAGYTPVWFANSISWGFDLVFTVAPTALKNARAFSPWLPLSDPRTKTYQDAYQKYEGETPDDLGIVGWGIGEIVGEALRRTGTTLGQNSFRATFQSLDYHPDIWAPLHFDPSTREGANFVAVLKESGGAWALEHDFTSGF